MFNERFKSGTPFQGTRGAAHLRADHKKKGTMKLLMIAVFLFFAVLDTKSVRATAHDVELGSVESLALEAKTHHADCVGPGAPLPQQTSGASCDKIARRAKQITDNAKVPCSVVVMVWVDITQTIWRLVCYVPWVAGKEELGFNQAGYLVENVDNPESRYPMSIARVGLGDDTTAEVARVQKILGEESVELETKKIRAKAAAEREQQRQ
jgi:hypothetical protein